MHVGVKNISKRYGNKKVLNDISFELNSGSILGLLGRNGAGKTTTLRCLLGIIPQDSGEILVNGEKINYEKLRIGYLPEERGIYLKRSVGEQLTYFARLKGMEKVQAKKAVKYWLEHLGMEGDEHKILGTLSKGNQQKIQLITAVINEPDILVLDEPFSGLDPVNSMVLKNVILEEKKKNKVIIFSSHQMSYVEEFCENIVIINQGSIVLSGNIQQIKKERKDRNKIIVQGMNIQMIASLYTNYVTVLNDNEIILHLDNENMRKEVLNNIIQDYEIDEFKVYEPSLNEIFISATK